MTNLDKVKKINEALEAAEPNSISVDTHTDYVGYKPQYIFDAMNDVLGLGNWGFRELSNELVSIGEDSPNLAVAQVKVWIRGIESYPTAYGQSKVTRGDFGDAKKGAQTDAIKKALSYFSIGNKAFHGLLEVPKGNAVPKEAKAEPKVDLKEKSDFTKTVADSIKVFEEKGETYCPKCGKPVSAKVYTFSMDEYGYPLCYSCQKEAELMKAIK